MTTMASSESRRAADVQWSAEPRIISVFVLLVLLVLVFAIVSYQSAHTFRNDVEPLIAANLALRSATIKALKEDGADAVRLRLKTGPGERQIPVEISLSPLKTEDGVLMMSSIRDLRPRTW